MPKPHGLKLTPDQARSLKGRRGRLMIAGETREGTLVVDPIGEGRYSVELVDFSQWTPRGYRELRLTAGMLEALELVHN